VWKTKDGTISPIIKTGLNWQNRIGTKNPAKIDIERSTAGTWNISVTDIHNDVVARASATDKELFAAGWFIVSYRYSSTRDRLLWLDDLEINGVFYEDTNMIQSNFLLNGNSEIANKCKKITNLKYLVDFSGEFNNKEINNLLIKRLCDKRGNCSENILLPFTPVWAEPGDILISEIMADPSPPVALPPKEYLEITNRSDYPINLKKWSLSFNDESVILPSLMVAPGDYIILCYASDTALFRNYGKVTGMKPFPALADDGKILALNDSLGNLIHGLEYSSDWYGNALKDGRWKL
jgi:hypothetical protein